MICVYDGSFEGLLTVAAETCHAGLTPTEVVRGDAWQPSLLDDATSIATDAGRAHALMDTLRGTGSQRIPRNVIYCYLSELPGFETPLVAYIARMVREGATADRHHSDDTVRAVHAMAQKVGHEIHRFTGLLRFRELSDGTLWAPLEPDHNIVYSVAVHFSRRLPNREWVVYDMRRDFGVAWKERRLVLVNMNPDLYAAAARVADAPDKVISADERHYQQLWNVYFRNIAIGTRINPRLQRNFMPQRYWAYLVEHPQRSGIRSQKPGVGSQE